MSKQENIALVLAGGRSRRMGQDKAALLRDGETQLDRTVRLLRGHVEDVFVSVRADQIDDPVRAGHSLLADKIEDIGPLGGIHAAMTHAEKNCLVVACDLPLLDDATISALVAAHTSSVVATAYASHYDGLPEPLCAIWSQTALPLVEHAIAEQRYCPRKILIQAGIKLLPAPTRNTLDNANTPEDLKRMEGAWL